MAILCGMAKAERRELLTAIHDLDGDGGLSEHDVINAILSGGAAECVAVGVTEKAQAVVAGLSLLRSTSAHMGLADLTSVDVECLLEELDELEAAEQSRSRSESF